MSIKLKPLEFSRANNTCYLVARSSAMLFYSYEQQGQQLAITVEGNIFADSTTSVIFMSGISHTPLSEQEMDELVISWLKGYIHEHYIGVDEYGMYSYANVNTIIYHVLEELLDEPRHCIVERLNISSAFKKERHFELDGGLIPWWYRPAGVKPCDISDYYDDHYNRPTGFTVYNVARWYGAPYANKYSSWGAVIPHIEQYRKVQHAIEQEQYTYMCYTTVSPSLPTLIKACTIDGEEWMQHPRSRPMMRKGFNKNSMVPVELHISLDELDKLWAMMDSNNEESASTAYTIFAGLVSTIPDGGGI